MKRTLSDGNKSVSFYFPSVDTIIMDDKTYLDRSRLKRLQVPQGFDCEMLKEAHRITKKHDTTDDCQLMQEVFKIDPCLILGGVNLHKLTYPGDLAILEKLMQEYIEEKTHA
jgi:2-C-methyl-D-erythritol 4-phosphate cytidylyltransferase